MLFSKSTIGFYKEGFNIEIPDDAIEVSNEIYSQIINGMSSYRQLSVNSDGIPFLESIEKTPEQLAEEYRAKRDVLLTASDWTQVADAPVDQAEWKVYRQALRDIPEQKGFPQTIAWPTQPE